ncbi:proline-specific peptidase [Calocera cornea HHB12733]|uniref:Proline-specific peptidase n=1 Tax=Calocera cornea HHB12733 TaxID=1353952 RepID=A0A165D814_9BASI|nr:proline-specific peptidase [Calocera cornea HHB12733]
MSSLLQPVTTGRIPFRTYETWYAIYGHLITPSKQPPLVVLHGGPGAGHDYLQSLGELNAIAEIPVVMYDQVGCGRSTHLRHAPLGTITIKLFLDELNNLLDALGLKEYDLLGQSWGGMLACEHAVRQPPGLRRLILEGTPASMRLAEQVRLSCYNDFPTPLRDALFLFDKDGVHTPEYQEARLRFRKTNGCRVDPLPAEMLATWDNMRSDSTVPTIMMGTSYIRTAGVLRDWSIIGRLPLIKCKVLVAHGQYDWCGVEAAEPFKRETWDAKVMTFEGAAHFLHLDQKYAFFQSVVEFLTE